MIVVVGTIAAIFIQTPLPVFKHAMSRFSWVLKPPPLRGEELIKKIVEWSNIARKQGLLGLEPLAEKEDDPFVRRGLQLVVDGGEPEDRKSTRLNSSHSSISYAVFCLNKKKCAEVHLHNISELGCINRF